MWTSIQIEVAHGSGQPFDAFNVEQIWSAFRKHIRVRLTKSGDPGNPSVDRFSQDLTT
jgi:hypothetical protein